MLRKPVGWWFAIIVTLAPLVAHASADPEPEPAPEPVSPRWEGGTRTRLRDGRWLLASAEHPRKHTYASFLWSPKNRRWKRTGDLRMPRYEHQATLLADGRVLVTGGYHVTTPGLEPQSEDFVDAEIGASAEVFDPATGLWSDAGTMNEERRSHTMTVLGDGRVLVVGGDPLGVGGTESADVWDPAAGVFTRTGEMHHARNDHSAIAMADGRGWSAVAAMVPPIR